jgi:hypothetical protein
MNTEKNKKKHANFQSDYNQSKNFTKTAKDEELEPIGKGNVKLVVENLINDTDKKKIANAMDKMRRGLENTEERVSQKEEE